MVTSVKIGDEAKDRLERLQAEIKLETGRQVTQQELLDRIVARAFESREALIDSYRDDWEGLSEDEIEQWLSGTSASDDPVAVDEIDRVIYGEEVGEFEDDA